MASSCDHTCAQGALTDFSGSLSDILLFDLYRQIYLTRLTGTLELCDGGMVKQISFRKGTVAFATTNDISKRLGNLLLAEGRITGEQLESVCGETGSGRRIGQIIVERGVIGREELDQCIRRYQSEFAIEALQWTRGSFRFNGQLTTEYEDVFIQLSTADIILEGARRIQNADAIHRLLGDPDRLVQLAVDPLSRFQTISLSTQEGYLLSRFERPMSIAEICRISALGETATMQALLGFVLAGILEYADTPIGERAAGTDSAPPSARRSKSPREVVAAAAPDSGAMKRILEAQTPYEILGVASNASVDEIRRAYLHLTNLYHPDKWGRAGPLEAADTAEKVYQLLETAYRVLSTHAQREPYNSEPSISRSVRSTQAGDSKTLGRVYTQHAAKRAFEDGVKLYQLRMYVAALAEFKQAVKLEQAMAPYRLHLAQTLAKLPGRSREAEFHFCVATHLSPWNREIKKAYEEFRRDPAHHDRVEFLLKAALTNLDDGSKAQIRREKGTRQKNP